MKTEPKLERDLVILYKYKEKRVQMNQKNQPKKNVAPRIFTNRR